MVGATIVSAIPRRGSARPGVETIRDMRRREPRLARGFLLALASRFAPLGLGQQQPFDYLGH